MQSPPSPPITAEMRRHSSSSLISHTSYFSESETIRSFDVKSTAGSSSTCTNGDFSSTEPDDMQTLANSTSSTGPSTEAEDFETCSEESGFLPLPDECIALLPQRVIDDIGVTVIPRTTTTTDPDIEATAADSDSPDSNDSHTVTVKPWSTLTGHERLCRTLFVATSYVLYMVAIALSIAAFYVYLRLTWLILVLLFNIVCWTLQWPFWYVVGLCNALWGFVEGFGHLIGTLFGLA